jgi:hypothetical protein
MKRALSIFGVGLTFRLVVIAYLAQLKPYMLSWRTNEAGVIARWIVTNHAFSSPFHGANGPTAWLGPIYPLIIAGCFLVFGVQTSASAVAVMIFNAICSAAAGVIAYEIGKEVYSEKAGLFAGWMWAFSSYVAMLPFILWDTSLSALLLGSALLLTLRLYSGKGDWTACGVTWGLAGLVSPALLAPWPVLVLLLLKRGRWKHVFIMSISTVITIAPWTVRNYAVFHEILPIRSNGLTEVYFVNCGFETHPLGQSMEYQRLGEAAFTTRANSRALDYIRTNPRVFFSDSLRRAMLFWIHPINFWPLPVVIDLAALAGLILLFMKSRTLALPILVVLVLFPLIYYASQVMSRYRHPIDPVLYALAGVAVSSVSLKRT